MFSRMAGNVPDSEGRSLKIIEGWRKRHDQGHEGPQLLRPAKRCLMLLINATMAAFESSGPLIERAFFDCPNKKSKKTSGR